MITPTTPKSIGRSLNLTAATSSSVANHLLAPHGLGLAQWAVLVTIWRNGPLGVKQISELTGNAPPATSRIIERMTQAGLVERRTATEDRRAILVDVTPRGEALRHLHDIYRQVNDAVLADLTEDEAETLFRLLDRVKQTGDAWLKSARARPLR